MIKLFIFSTALLLGLLGCTAKVEVKQNEKPLSTVNPTDSLNVAFLIMDGTFNSEFTAPFDIFHHTIFRKNIAAMNVFSIAQDTLPITTFEGIRIQPDYSYLGSHPSIDVLVVPSAEHYLDSDLQNESLIGFVQTTSATAQYVMSLCDGAFVLAKAGVLEARTCTTFPGDIQEMRNMFPTLDIMEDVLFVHDGKFITGVGGAKSFEPALYLTELLYGRKVAEEIAKGMVIDWNRSDFAYKVIETSDSKNQ